MNYPLAIFTTDIGAPSETFIRRHIQDLLPGRTVTIAYNVWHPISEDWSLNCPVLVRKPLDWSAVRNFLKQHAVQVMMGEYLDESLACLGVAYELGIRFFAHAHGYDVSQRLRDPKWRAEYLRYNEADGVITMSQASRVRLEDLGLSSHKLQVVPYGVDVPDVLPVLRPGNRTPRCLAVGRMVAKKAPLLTMEAFRQAAEAYPEMRLCYIGAGELLPILKQFIHDSNLEDKVSLLGGQPNRVVQQMMRDSDIFLQHSMTDPNTGDEEGLPIAILEAMSHALPVVSTRHAGIPEAVIHGSTGYLAEEGDSQGMAELIKVLVAQPQLRRQMGNAGWARAKEHFSWKRERAELTRILGIHQDE